jgi:hypothetical protein
MGNLSDLDDGFLYARYRRLRAPAEGVTAESGGRTPTSSSEFAAWPNHRMGSRGLYQIDSPDNPKQVANGKRTRGLEALFCLRAIVCETGQLRTRRDELF